MATSASAPSLVQASFIPTSRDRTTPLIAAGALLALAFAPWGEGGTPSALSWALSGTHPKWPAFAAAWSLGPLVAAALAMLVLSWIGRDRATTIAAALGVVWGFGEGLVAGTQGPSWGIGAAIAISLTTVVLARALARSGAFKGDPTIATIVVTIAALLLIFIFYPVGKSLLTSVLDVKGNFAPELAAERLFTRTSGGSVALEEVRAAASPSTPLCSPSSSASDRHCWASCSRLSCSVAANVSRACCG